MPRFIADVEKELGGERWTNRYMLDAATLTEAHGICQTIAATERNIHSTEVNFKTARTRDDNPGSDVYAVTTLTGAGARTAGTSRLPLFNVARVDFMVEAGRPSRKYLRLPFYEGDVENGMLETSLSIFIANEYAIPLVGLAGFVDVDGQAIIGQSVITSVAMRQLRRGSKRKLEPILT